MDNVVASPAEFAPALGDRGRRLVFVGLCREEDGTAACASDA
ncbi:MAG TPA: hypothetical protein VFZ53_05430 [Polyangiaceae bacterium]